MRWVQYFKCTRIDGTKLKEKIGKKFPILTDNDVGKDIMVTFNQKMIPIKIPCKIIKIVVRLNRRYIYVEEFLS